MKEINLKLNSKLVLVNKSFIYMFATHCVTINLFNYLYSVYQVNKS